jgi:hypothetical protein
METKWTPGPWRVNKYGSVGAGETGALPIVAEVQPIYGADLRYGSHAANARLIAAAPELYEALEAIGAVFLRRGTREEYDNAYRQAGIAALAKARGEP